MHISPKVITTNSVDFGGFGAFWWENVFQLSFVLINADLPWNIYQGEQLTRFIPAKTYGVSTKRKLTAFEPYVKFAF